MLLRSIVPCVLVMAAQGLAVGQTEPVTRADLDQFKTDLRAEMRMIVSEALARPAQPGTGDAAAEQAGDDGLDPVAPVPAWGKDLADRATALESKVEAMEAEQRNQGVQLGNVDALALAQRDQAEMLRQITIQSGPNSYHVRLDANSQTGRDEIARAMKDAATQATGDFRVRNLTGRDEYIIVNGQQHLVLAGAELSLKVTPGTVTSRLRHQHQPLSMYVGFPNYFQSVDIKPPASSTSSVVYYRPVTYTAAPGWYVAN